jgi:hypothetical protein
MNLNWSGRPLDLHGSGGEAIDASGLDDLANGERETVCHGREVGDDDHLAHLGSCMHTPYLVCHYRRDMVGSLPRDMPPMSTRYGWQSTEGMPKVVDCR